MALTVTRANKKPYTVKPIVSEPKTATAESTRKAEPSPPLEGSGTPPAAATITAEEVQKLEARCTDNEIAVNALKKKAGVSSIADIKSDDLPRAHTWLDAVIAKRKAA